MLLAVQAGTTAGAAAITALLDLHTHAPLTAALISYGALVAAWGRLVHALNAAAVPARALLLLGATLLLAYALTYMTIPSSFSGARPVPATLPGAHRFVEALYFTTTTATTVGYGDRTPETTFARLLVMSQYSAAACVAVLIANHFA